MNITPNQVEQEAERQYQRWKAGLLQDAVDQGACDGELAALVIYCEARKDSFKNEVRVLINNIIA